MTKFYWTINRGLRYSITHIIVFLSFFLITADLTVILESITLYYGDMYHKSQYYNKIYTFNRSYNRRPIYEYLDKAVIKWDEFKLSLRDESKLREFDQMAWIIGGTTNPYIRFVSFSDVIDPRLAEDWKYINNEMQLIDTPDLYLA